MSKHYPLSKGDFDERVRKIRNMMEERRLDVLVIFSNSSALGPGTSTHGYIRYVCNWTSALLPSLLILPGNGDPTLLVPMGPDVPHAKELTGFTDVKLRAPGGYGMEAAETLHRLNLNGGVIGLVGIDEMPASISRDLLKRLPKRGMVNADDILDELRMVKSEKEIRLMREAARISDAMIEALVEDARDGEWAYRAMANMEHAAKREGAEYASTWIISEPVSEGRVRFTPAEAWKKMELGDQILAGTFLIKGGYYSHQIRTGVRGKPSREVERVFDVCLEAQDAGIDAMKPGAYVSDVDTAMEGVIQRNYPSGAGELRFRSGHPIGLDYSEKPASNCFPQFWLGERIPPVPQVEIKPGMVFELHPNLFPPGKGGAAIGDVCVVKNKGVELLHKFPRELFRV